MVANGNFSISAIIPVYNGEAFLDQTVKSLLGQTVPLHEIIIIDDCSTDNTPAIACQLAATNRLIRVITQTVNQGVSVARNIGCQHANSNWVLFMDGDDLAGLGLAEAQMEALTGFEKRWGEKPVLVYGAYQIINESGVTVSGISRSKQLTPDEILGCELVRNAIISASGALVRKDSFSVAGGFDSTVRYAEDYDLWLRLARLGGFAYVDQPLVKIRRHSRNVSKDLTKMLEGEKTVLKKYSPAFIRQAIVKRNLPPERNLTDFVAVMFKIDQWDEGYRELEKVIATHPNLAPGHFLRGVYFLHSQEWDAAKNAFGQTVALDQNHGAALNNLGALLMIAGEIGQAKELLKRAMTMYPGYLDACSNLDLLENGITPDYQSVRFTWRELRPVLLSY
jgi:glycosyltransferase involved in cell wall biosynthesis